MIAPNFSTVKRMFALGNGPDNPEQETALDWLDTLPEELSDAWDTLVTRERRTSMPYEEVLKLYAALPETPEFERIYREYYSKNNGGKPKSEKGRGRRRKPIKTVFAQARRAPRTAEAWRILKNYSQYEISNHGRLRRLDRIAADDVIKPCFRWHYGKLIRFFQLWSDGKQQRVSRFEGTLMLEAGWMKSPEWRK